MNTLTRSMLQLFTCALAVWMLSACGGDDAGSSGGGSTQSAGTEVAATQACFENACAEITPLVDIPDAENLIFSADGRLFVSGGTNVFEITKSGTTFAAAPLAAQDCNFTGLTIARSTLYANCGDGSLWAGSLSTRPMSIKRIFQMTGVALANGLVDGPDGRSLYLADGPLPTSSLPSPKLVKLTLDATDPMTVLTQATWLDLAGRFPNGVQRKGNFVYFTESQLPNLGQLSAVQIRTDGSAGTVSRIASLSTIPDDFSILADGFAVTYFVTGQVVRLGLGGQVVSQFSEGTFTTGTSQARQGVPPMFSATDLLVTEKGLLGESFTPIGNRLTLVKKIP
jgi:hypothetical protein